MTYYKDYRITNGKPRLVIVDKNGKIVNRNPSKDELKGIKIKESIKRVSNGIYNDTNTCDRCGISFENTLGHPLREYNNVGDWTGRWDCSNCYQKYDPNSYNNIRKSLRDCRTYNQDPNSPNAKGDNFEKLTSRWLGVKKLSMENDYYNGPFDHSSIPDGISIKIGDKLVDLSGKILQTKGRFYNSRGKWWKFSSFDRDWSKEFHYEICYCTNKYGNTIDRIYIIPFEKEIKGKRKGITIVKNPMNSRNTSPIIPWYEQYRITDEETIKKVNEIWIQIRKT